MSLSWSSLRARLFLPILLVVSLAIVLALYLFPDQRQAWGGLAAAGVLAAATWIGMEARRARRLGLILHTAKRLGVGELRTRSGLGRGDDEFAVLARTFDEMASTLELRARELVQSRFFLEKAQEMAHIGSWIWDPHHGGRLTLSPEAYRIFGFSDQHPFDHRIETIFGCVHPDDQERVKQASHDALSDGKSYRIDHRIVRPDGTVRWVHEQVEIVRDTTGVPISVVGVVQDVTLQVKRQKHIRHLAYYDTLTELPNRALFNDRLQRAITEADRHKHLVGVMLLDLDRFKNVNDSLGHDAGDQLLKAVAGRLTKVMREGDTVARLGGDEFTVILANMAHASDAARVVQKIMQAFALPFSIAQRDLYVGASVGITLYPSDDRSVPNLLRNADIAMYRAKETGRNRHQFYTTEMTVKAEERLALENDLQRALREREFFLAYQPIVSTRTAEIVGIEALLRWQHPTRGLILPERFIPLAEETGLVVDIGDWVLHTACQQASDWQRQGMPELVMSVNLAARHFRQSSLLQTLRQVRQQIGGELPRLELEMTEGTLFGQDPTTVSLLRELTEMGVSLAIDDFGTGYSSLSYLQRFPIKTLKIDKDFIRGIPSNPDSTAIVITIITLAHTLGMRVVAEGVETAEQLQFLRWRQCDAYQGHYFSRPVSPPEMERLLTSTAVCKAG